MRGPLVTVVILSHRSHFLPACLQSVFNQTEQDFQIIVQHCKKNWSTKLNEAASIAHGEFIIPLCDDDLIAPTYIEECLKRAHCADVIYTDRLCWQEGEDPALGEGVRVHQLGEHFTEANAGPKGYFTTQFPPDIFSFGSTLPMTCMIRRAFWQRMGGYDPEMPHADTEFYLRAAIAEDPQCRFVYIPQPLFWYHLHETQYSKTYKNSLDDAMRMYHTKHFERFGVLWDMAKHIEGEMWEVVTVAPEHRAAVLAKSRALSGQT